MTTYAKIQDFVKSKWGITVKDCWIAHVKAIHGLNTKKRTTPRVYPCPPEHIHKIELALMHYGSIKKPEEK